MGGILALEDGRLFRGRSFGSSGERVGEVVFNTAMTGYQEVLTDPSYRGQIVAMTCPQIGNYGTNGIDRESTTLHVRGFVVREVSVLPSNWRANQGLPQYLREHGIPGLCEVDTRALTRHIRSHGAMKAVLSSSDQDPEGLVRRAREAPGLEAQDLVGEVTGGGRRSWSAGVGQAWARRPSGDVQQPELHCVAFDFGMKENILRHLHDRGFRLTVVPADCSAEEALALEPDAVFLSNGPGDPAVVRQAIETVRELIGKVPIFGICLGHQIAALALGASTFKLKFGHRGANHPVQDLRTGKVAITSQNHGYAVEARTLPPEAVMTHVNLNDQTCAGFVHARARLLAVQYHPESSPGPHDSHGLFDEFRAMATGGSPPGPRPAEESA